MFRPDDIVEAREDLRCTPPITAGQRLVVQQSSASGMFVQFFGWDEFVRASAFHRVGRMSGPGEAAA
jgi:hypothetical protein